MKLYDEKGHPTQEGLVQISKVIGGKLRDNDIIIDLPPTPTRTTHLEWNSYSRRWLFVGYGDSGTTHAPEHVRAWQAAMGSIYAHLPDEVLKQYSDSRYTYAKVWRAALDADMITQESVL